MAAILTPQLHNLITGVTMQLTTDTQKLDLSDFAATPKDRGSAEVSFPNGYGASIIHHKHSYGYSEGLFELAVLHDGDICYSTNITGDVLGYLSAEDVLRILDLIKQLPE